jgi:hypothetical protein
MVDLVYYQPMVMSLPLNGNVFEIETNEPKKTLLEKIKYELERVFQKYRSSSKTKIKG